MQAVIEAAHEGLVAKRTAGSFMTVPGPHGLGAEGLVQKIREIRRFGRQSLFVVRPSGRMPAPAREPSFSASVCIRPKGRTTN